MLHCAAKDEGFKLNFSPLVSKTLRCPYATARQNNKINHIKGLV
jgi:hypothetical protein